MVRIVHYDFWQFSSLQYLVGGGAFAIIVMTEQTDSYLSARVHDLSVKRIWNHGMHEKASMICAILHEKAIFMVSDR